MLTWNLSQAEFSVENAAQLSRQIKRLYERSAFYREKWEGHVLNHSSLPLIDKRDLHESLQNDGLLGANLCVEPDELSHIHTSSGTSGKPTYFGLTTVDYAAWMKIFMRGFQIAGVRPADRVLHAFAMSRGYAGGVPMVDSLYQMGCAVLPIGAEAGAARLVDAVDRLRPRVLYASPSMARHIAERYVDATGRAASGSSVELLVTGGEPGAGDPRSKALFAEMWGADVRELAGGTDVCPMMLAECHVQQGLHFIAGDEVALEIINPENGKLLGSSGQVTGEVVYSHLRREASPVMRMRHGDLVTADFGPCSCDLRTVRLRFMGRSDDMVIVRGVKVFPSSVQEIVSEFAPQLTGRFVISQSTKVSADGLYVTCETSSSSADLRVAFERRARELLGVRVHCEFVQPNSLEIDSEHKGRWVRDVRH